MTFWTAARVTRALGRPGVANIAFSTVSTDTRSLEENSLFVALSGDRFDGHAFLDEAREAGATGAVVREGTPRVVGLALYPVEDTLRALGMLARERRRSIQGPVIAITGTNGKTATKELVKAVLSVRWHVHATRENLNNLVGVPLTILEAPGRTEALVVEAGANEPGEIARLRDIIEPTVAIVTNVSAGHVQGFGSLEGTMVEKLQLAAGAPLAIVGTDPVELGERARQVAERVVQAGLGAGADMRPDRALVQSDGCGVLQLGNVRVDVPFRGRHQLDNTMLALAVAQNLNISVAEAGARVAYATIPARRCEVIDCSGLLDLNDANNANPASVVAALDTVSAMRGDRRLVVLLGTMLELGDDSAEWHADVAERILEYEPSVVGVTGAFIDAFARHRERLGDRLIPAADAASLGRAVAPYLDENDLVLLKASRGVRLEEARPHIMSESDRPCSSTS